jgi:Na+/H+ antiporter NhaA
MELATQQEPAESSDDAYAERTPWTQRLKTPLRAFLRAEAGSAAVLVGAIVVALVWANVDNGSYERAWSTQLSVRLGDAAVSLDLRRWVNSGLMTFFFFVVGLEARREFDLGELRERRRFVLPLAAGLTGMLVPALVYLAINAGRPSAGAWGVAISTDTAFALGTLALLGRRVPGQVRTFLLTALVVDDVVALVVIAVVYSQDVRLMPLLVALGIFVVPLALRAAGVRNGPVYVLTGAAVWLAVLASGVDPIVVGLVMGLLTYAYNPRSDALDRAAELFRRFREQPTPEFARSAGAGLAASLSLNERLQQLWLPWTGYVIVPLFALANAGIVVDADFLMRAVRSPVTIGVVVAYLAGKPVGILGSSWLVTRLTGGRVRPPVGWAAVAGGGAVAGTAFTVSILVAALSLKGDELREATFGVLVAAAGAALTTWGVFRVTARLPPARRLRALLGNADPLVDLATPVDLDRDHVRGPVGAPVTVVEYGDFQCPYCGRAEPVVRELLAGQGDVRYVWRHLPLPHVHPEASLAAEAAEAAAAQDAFWPMHDLLLERQEHLQAKHLLRYAQELGLDVDRFRDDLREHRTAGRVAEDVESAELSGVSGTPTFFVNGHRHYGAYDIASLRKAVATARARVEVAAQPPPRPAMASLRRRRPT